MPPHALDAESHHQVAEEDPALMQDDEQFLFQLVFLIMFATA